MVAESLRLSQRAKEEIAGYLFISPWVVGFIAFTAGPMAISLYLSLCRADFMTPTVFVGLDNYRNILFHDPLFTKSLANTAYYSFISVPLGIALGLAIALLLNAEYFGMRLFRTVYYLPSVVSGVAVALLWQWILNPQFGIMNALLAWLGLPQPKWLFSEQWAKPALIIMSLWGAGGSMMIFLAGLRGVPQELYEAVSLDGANAIARFRSITLPMITPTLFFTLVTGIIGSFQVFTAAFIMTAGGPNNATLMYVLNLYNQAFMKYHFGYASGLAWILLFIILALTLLVFKSSAMWVYYEAEVKAGR
ncbi:MAG: sugar ABC transporter permease [Anaerolineae bacterium]|nr:sugar ABC transporter permease [Anaerolineae bacterium]